MRCQKRHYKEMVMEQMKFCSRKIFSFGSDVNSYGDSQLDRAMRYGKQTENKNRW